MSWKDLLQPKDETIVYPWAGQKAIQTYERTWNINGQLPNEYGWHEFSLNGRKAKWNKASHSDNNILKNIVFGYLVGDRLIPDNISATLDIQSLTRLCKTVHLIESGLDRFSRISAGTVYENGPLIFNNQEMPIGPESDVLQFFLDKEESTAKISGISPALDSAFKIETWRRKQEEILAKEEQEKREKEDRRKKIEEQLGDGALRRQVALHDFGAAAMAALAVGGAEYLDHRNGYDKNEMIVRFRLNGRRFECTCNSRTLQVIDSGICLASSGDDGFEYGFKGDKLLTLESIPSVLREAIDEDKLVVFRHA